ncbi:hypothetical protein POTOM_006704 [Populus tomentosa]|uniref:NB-ARC domain-containing protein n=1 Tax=Populus tomentosa TaxID=118781 RepID=A0A8X8ATR5_POPTO|nr:hypothetical protein POTOM_006704 [Populus tomentosa]
MPPPDNSIAGCDMAGAMIEALADQLVQVVKKPGEYALEFQWVLGTTTISQKIFNNSKQLVDRFVKRVWLSISQIVSEEEIMKTMLKQLDQYVNGLDMAQTLPKIKRLLENKNCLAVMDDAVLKAEMGVEKARIHQPRTLNEEESLASFSKIAFHQMRKQNSILIWNSLEKDLSQFPCALTAKESENSVMASLHLSCDVLPHLSEAISVVLFAVSGGF